MDDLLTAAIQLSIAHFGKNSNYLYLNASVFKIAGNTSTIVSERKYNQWFSAERIF